LRIIARLPRLFTFFLPFALLASLTIAIVSMPQPVRAQESAPAASSSSSESSSTSSEQKEMDTFRHAPIVEAIGKKLGLDTETTAKLFELLNFLIVFFAIVIPLAKVMPKMLRNRKQTLSQNLRTAREATEDAKSRLKAVEAKLAGLDDEIAKFRAQVEQDSLEDEKRIKAALADETARIVSAAEQEIAAAAAQARRALRTFAADLAIEHAEKQLVLTPETDRALINEFIAEVAAGPAGKGGKN
jgi:F-type H+-transporting ATPase subunit b